MILTDLMNHLLSNVLVDQEIGKRAEIDKVCC